ncbi:MULTISPECIES: ABC transporter ATP-binding protein [Salipiger]|uniref:Amino acid/amide ABC transporter ATP-binding protein 1, HAAT family n=1 Tax=Salipiger profundus TaxID=1229727 RepID=A0A1U7DDF8_9RHOB|nr:MULTISPECIES: ABC transporter ATP-binding protein [Salipiger]APX26169.1 amino acid/amide ABC transporter ATP-binding protein 1, HAAT family [Salipiger profundus]GGA23565.1 ABC transporter ATP-binding protein [Salipiger profundus]
MADFVLETRNLTKSFGGFKAVSDVSLQVKRGNIHALIGPNGAGKTTCFNLITNFLTPTSGQILLDGRNVTGIGASQIARMGMVRSFQISATFGSMTVLENVRIALQRREVNTFNFWSSERGLDRLNGRAMELLDWVGLADLAQRSASELSYGRRRALEIAATLAQEPSVLLLDEPMAGMGREDIRTIADLIRRISASRTILMVEHNLSVVADLSDRITVLARGQVLAEGVYAEVSKNPDVIDAYMGGQHA